MNIAFLVDSIAHGGAGRVVSLLANGLSADGNDVTIIVSSDSEHIYRLNTDIKFVPLKYNNKINVFQKIKLINKVCKKNSIDVLVTFMTELNVFGIVASIGSPWKVIISERNDPVLTPKDKRIRALRSIMYPFADGYIFQTEEIKSFFSKRIQNNCQIIINPLMEKLPEVYTGEQNAEIVAVGRLNKQKNYPMLITAFEGVHEVYPEYCLKIYGEGPERSYLERLIVEKELQDCVSLMGQVSDIYERIKKSKLFVMSSDYEGLSNALMEAMALGLPVISTDHGGGGARELIKDGINGLLVPINDADELKEKMIKLIKNPDLSRQLGMNASKIRKTTSQVSVCKKWVQYIDRIYEG